MLIGNRYDANENLRPVLCPLEKHWSFLDPDQAGSDYKQVLNMRTGMLTTSWRQGDFKIESETVLDPTREIVAQEWTFTWENGANFSLPYPDTNPPASTEVKGFVRDGGRLIPQATNNTGRIEEVWRIDRGAYPSFSQVEKDALSEWTTRWQTDIVIDGPAPDQLAIHSWLFYLRSTVGGTGASLAPFGLSNRRFHGHIFWDSDIWTFPALVLIDPEAAKAISNYRLAHVSEATANAGGQGMRFPWESAVTGKDVAPSTFANELHVTGDVAFMLDQAAALGLAPSDKVQEVINGANRFFLSKSITEGGERTIPNVRSPDEYRKSVTDLYTNCLAQWLAGHASPPAPVSYHLPHDSIGLVSYEGDPVQTYQQASAILAIYPLQDPRALAQAKTMMKRFPPRVTKFGPAMSQSLEALILAKLGHKETAYAAWRSSWIDFSSPGLLLFGEKKDGKETYFDTGAAGCLQAVLYGFLGFGIDWHHNRQAVWATRLKGGHWLNLQPNLPERWKSVTLRNFTVLGKRYTLTVSHNRTTVTEGEP